MQSFTPNENDLEGMDAKMDMFSTLPLNTAIKNSYFEEYRPQSVPTRGAPIEFNVSAGAGTHYIDLSRTRLNVKVKITGPGGQPIPEDKFAALICFPLHT